MGTRGWVQPSVQPHDIKLYSRQTLYVVGVQLRVPVVTAGQQFEDETSDVVSLSCSYQKVTSTSQTQQGTGRLQRDLPFPYFSLKATFMDRNSKTTAQNSRPSRTQI